MDRKAASQRRLVQEKVRQENAEAARKLKEEAEEKERRLVEVIACMNSFTYFVDKYCYIYDSGPPPSYIPFHLWPGQKPAVDAVVDKRLVVLLKARQLGMTWLCLAYALWRMVFNEHENVLLFSLKENEAFELVDRLSEMWRRLPEWMRIPGRSLSGSLTLDNGSVARAFSTAGGDSYNATLAIIDEADLVPDLDRLMGRVKPTIDAGGKLFLVSRVDKKEPESHFKKLYRSIQAGKLGGDWHCVFLPWHVRPSRDAAWYEAQKAYSLETTGSLDKLHEQYPATAEEALAANTLDKRFPAAWLAACFVDAKPLNPITFKPDAPLIPQMRVFVTPDPRRAYTMGADPAQGNPNSDDSALTILDNITGEEVCNLVGKFEPAMFASMIDKLAKWYKCPVMVERNNHGHAVILWLKDHGRCRLLDGPDDDVGFYTTSVTKINAYDKIAEDIRGGRLIIHDSVSYYQLSSIEAASLSAPDTMHDDRAMSWVLANWGRGIGGVNFSALAKPVVDTSTSFVHANKQRIFG